MPSTTPAEGAWGQGGAVRRRRRGARAAQLATTEGETRRVLATAVMDLPPSRTAVTARSSTVLKRPRDCPPAVVADAAAVMGGGGVVMGGVMGRVVMGRDAAADERPDEE